MSDKKGARRTSEESRGLPAPRRRLPPEGESGIPVAEMIRLADPPEYSPRRRPTDATPSAPGGRSVAVNRPCEAQRRPTEAEQQEGTLEAALRWARRMGQDEDRVRARWLEMEGRGEEWLAQLLDTPMRVPVPPHLRTPVPPAGEAQAEHAPQRRQAVNEVWAVEQLRYREWRVCSLHWTREDAEGLLADRDPRRWRVVSWLVA